MSEELAIQAHEELMTTLGSIEGLLIFFAVALVCWLVYKFLRMFF